MAAEHDLDWAYWALQGSYALRQGVAGMDEVYGVLDWSWSKARNETVLPRIQALQRPIQGQLSCATMSERSMFQWHVRVAECDARDAWS